MFFKAKPRSNSVEIPLQELESLQRQLRVYDTCWEASCELLRSRDERIASLETEVARLMHQLQAQARWSRTPVPEQVPTDDLPATNYAAMLVIPHEPIEPIDGGEELRGRNGTSSMRRPLPRSSR